MEVLHPYKILSFARSLDFSRWMNNNDNNKLGTFRLLHALLSAFARSILQLFFSSRNNSLMLLLSRISQSDSLYYYLSGFKWTQSRMSEREKLVKTFYELFLWPKLRAKKRNHLVKLKCVLNQIARELTYL